jgi:hypothetical protein
LSVFPHVFFMVLLSCSGFLLEENELDINYSEWLPLTTKIPEDITKLPFSHSRNFTFNHPRTTMLMFGPKNAPTNQTQFLYIPGLKEKNLSAEELARINPTRGVIMTLTFFLGIPMCDVFKVLQFWSFEQSASNPAAATQIKVGLAIHYMKSTMFKSQIFGGSKEELTEQSAKWIQYATRYCAAATSDIPDTVEECGGIMRVDSVDHSGSVGLRRTSLKRRDSAATPLVPLSEEAAAALGLGLGSGAGAGSLGGGGGGGEDTPITPVASEGGGFLTSVTGTAAIVADEIAGELSTLTHSLGDAVAGQAAAAAADDAAATPSRRSAGAAAPTPSVPVSSSTAATYSSSSSDVSSSSSSSGLPFDMSYLTLFLGCSAFILLVLLYRQSAHNATLVQQIKALSDKIDSSQASFESSLKQSQAMLAQMESVMKKLQK